MQKKPNIVLIMTDQQRADSINALGFPWMKTPNLDRLVNEGTAFTNCFVTSPVCVASRASVFRGAYPHTTNVYTNFEAWEPNWVPWLADSGYHCVNIGKMHINPYDAKGGFHQRFMVENKDWPLFLDQHERAIYDEWDKALKARGLEKPSRYTRVKNDRDHYINALGCFTWEVDDDMQRLHRHYAANVTMIDEKVGEIIDVLARKNYLDNTIIIFCSDHADALGEHGHIQKWTMYDCVTKVPLVVWMPESMGGNQQADYKCDDLVQLMDIAPTILDFCGIEMPNNWEALSLTPMITNGAWDANNPEAKPGGGGNSNMVNPWQFSGKPTKATKGTNADGGIARVTITGS